MPEDVWCDVAGKPSLLGPVPESAVEVAGRDALSSSTHEQSGGVFGETMPPLEIQLKQPGHTAADVPCFLRAACSLDGGRAGRQV